MKKSKLSDLYVDDGAPVMCCSVQVAEGAGLSAFSMLLPWPLVSKPRGNDCRCHPICFEILPVRGVSWQTSLMPFWGIHHTCIKSVYISLFIYVYTCVYIYMCSICIHRIRVSVVMAAPSDGILPMDVDKGALVFSDKAQQLSKCFRAEPALQNASYLILKAVAACPPQWLTHV